MASSQDGALSLDANTIVTAILVPLLLTVLGVWLAIRWRDKLRVRVGTGMGSAEFQALAALYCERIPDYERVPPQHFRAFFTRDHSAHSVSDFRRRVRDANASVHLLLVARTSKALRGFLKAILIPESRCLFIAYLVSDGGTDDEGRSVTQELLSTFLVACKGTTVASVVFEICASPESSPEAKGRLFRHYAASHDLKLRMIEAPYQQPEICAFESGDCKVTDARLYLAYLGQPAQGALASMDREQYRDLVSSIYKHVYLKSYALAEPELTARYCDFLNRVRNSMFASLRTKTVALK